MKYNLEPFTIEHLENAGQLFLNSYQHAKKANPLLPSSILNEPKWINDNLRALLKNPGITISVFVKIVVA